MSFASPSGTPHNLYEFELFEISVREKYEFEIMLYLENSSFHLWKYHFIRHYFICK